MSCSDEANIFMSSPVKQHSSDRIYIGALVLHSSTVDVTTFVSVAEVVVNEPKSSRLSLEYLYHSILTCMSSLVSSY